MRALRESQEDAENVATQLRKAYQRHHDFYVQRFRSGLLGQEADGQEHYDVAMRRELEGKVKPLP